MSLLLCFFNLECGQEQKTCKTSLVTDANFFFQSENKQKMLPRNGSTRKKMKAYTQGALERPGHLGGIQFGKNTL